MLATSTSNIILYREKLLENGKEQLKIIYIYTHKALQKMLYNFCFIIEILLQITKAHLCGGHVLLFLDYENTNKLYDLLTS